MDTARVGAPLAPEVANGANGHDSPLSEPDAAASPDRLLVQGSDAATSSKTTRVTVLMPCLNEEWAVGGCVSRALEALRAAKLDGEVLVIDNGSTDGSIAAARNAGARVLRQSEPGYGAALRSGIEAATTEYIVMADADGTYELEAIPRLLQPLVDDEADLVLGARLNGASSETMPFLHRFLGTPVLSILVNRAAGQRLRIRDSQSGFRAFRREQFEALGCTSTGMEFASEMLIRYAWARFRIKEVDTHYAERIGESKLEAFSDGLRHVRQILLLSPEVFALDPGLALTGLSFLLWGLACISTQGLGRIGSLSWLAILVAGICSVIGPIVYCTGLVIRYRAQSLGLRHAPPKRAIHELIRRFFVIGLWLLVLAVSLVVLAVVDYHEGRFFTGAAVRVLVSVAGSAAIVGIVLACAPVLMPFMQGPIHALPNAEEVAAT
jgi:glycosyltransferase involved in cell wall biosynthesis